MHSNWKKVILNAPFFVMTLFAILHMAEYVRFEIAGEVVTLSAINKMASMIYLGMIYLWALFVNRKWWIRIVAIVMGALSVCGILISLNDFGHTINDLLCAGDAVLTLLYVFENAQYLMRLVKKYDKYLTVAIWSFVAFSVILFVFFPSRQHQWGEGTFFFGHKYASVLCLEIILIGLKLMNRPKKSWIYWCILFVCYYLCFWTGARVYMLAGLGQIYGLLYVFRCNNKDFIIKCVIVTLAVLLFYSTSSASQKVENIQADWDSSMPAESKIDSLGQGRLTFWKKGIACYQDLPVSNKLLGSGNRYLYSHIVLWEGFEIHTHNDYLNILHFNGAIGLFIYLSIFVAYAAMYWKRNRLPVVLLIGFWGTWFVLAALNGYAHYTANMMSVPYLGVLACWEKSSGHSAG